MHFCVLSLKTCFFCSINIRIVCMLLLLLVNLCLPAQGIYHFRHISTKEGLSNNEVKKLFFDKQGSLWIGTQDGWNCWDGHQVTMLSGQEEKLPASFKRQIAFSIHQTQPSWKYISAKNQLSISKLEREYRRLVMPM